MTDVDTRADLLRVRFRDHRRMTLGHAGLFIQGTDDYVYLMGIAQTSFMYRAGQPVSSEAFDFIIDRVVRGGPFAYVQRIHYGSPFEIILAISSVSGLTLAFANRLIATFNNYNEARVTKAKADAQVIAYNTIKEDLIRGTGQQEYVQRKSTDVRIEKAATAMTELESIEVIPPDEAH